MDRLSHERSALIPAGWSYLLGCFMQQAQNLGLLVSGVPAERADRPDPALIRPPGDGQRAHLEQVSHLAGRKQRFGLNVPLAGCHARQDILPLN
jgi:hypothetical protein